MGSRSSSKRKSKRDKISSKKKSRRKESKKRLVDSDSFSSSCNDDSLDLERRSSSRRITKNKRRRHDTPLLDNSDYESASSDSDSSSADDYNYKARKSRRSRVGSKDTKRKGRKRSISSDDVDATRRRKRRRLGKDHDVRPMKKSSKKKSRKVLLSSSSGSDSESCSDTQSRSSSSSGDEKCRKSIVVIDRKKERVRHRRSGKDKQKHDDRSPICTSIDSGLGPHFDLGYEEEVIPVDNPRRLKSIITFVNQPRDEEEENVWEKDPHKEEIVYDANDYPSPRSFDSNEGGSKIENIAGEAVHQSEKSRIDGGDRLPEGDCMKNSEEIDTSAPVAALEGDVLESILRQKALENLRKLRVKPQARDTVKIHDETNVVTLSNTTVDIVHKKSIKIEQGASDAEEINQRTTEVVKLSGSEHVEKKPRIADLSVTQSHNESALLERSKEDKSSLSQAAEAEVVSGNDTSHVAGLAGDAKARSSNVELSSSIKPTSEEHSSEKAKDSSQFEQKTMTVIRGGEQVQVSYKVYIPKKAPGMVRRQLKR